MDLRLRTAIDATVTWYADVFATHNVPARLDRGLWRSLTPPPALHSQAVVVEPAVTTEQIIMARRDGLTAGVNDSFATLDLDEAGLSVLFTATWVHHPPTPPSRSELSRGWSIVSTADELAEWNASHDTDGVLLPSLLDRGTYRFLARRSADAGHPITAGLVARLGCGAVHVSNVHAFPGQPFSWHEVVAAAGACFPGRPLVGYEQGPDLDAALAAGFDPVGDLRVWVP